MSFRWLKRYMPRSLYGRALLILILPVVTLQLVISVVFIQRHIEGVTEQMTGAVSRELRTVLERVEQADTRDSALATALPLSEPLELGLSFVEGGELVLVNQRRWYDFSGLVVIRSLNRLVLGVRAVKLPDDRLVNLFVDTRHGVARVDFNRRLVSARNTHQLFVNMIFFGGLMTVIAYLYLRNQLRPITRLARAAEAFGRGRTIPYSPAGAVEVRAAGNAFLDMRARIERQIEQRTMMLSGVSHDLRTPLTRLKLGLSLLEDEDREPLERDVEDMQRLLDEFLSFARGASEGDPEEVDPHAMVARIVEDCARAGQDVELASCEGEGMVMLRPLALRRAVENLIGNAVRYGTRAEVSVWLGEKSLRIRVEDDGPGIPADRREEAVKPFARLDAARNQDKGTGVGLGLAIAADAARAHGGILRLGESESLGGLRADIVMAR